MKQTNKRVGRKSELLKLNNKEDKEIPCRYFNGSEGSCKYGAKCNFLHDTTLSTTENTSKLRPWPSNHTFTFQYTSSRANSKRLYTLPISQEQPNIKQDQDILTRAIIQGDLATMRQSSSWATLTERRDGLNPLFLAASCCNLEVLSLVEKHLGTHGIQYWLSSEFNAFSNNLMMPTRLQTSDNSAPSYSMLFNWYEKFSQAPWRNLYDELMLQSYGCSQWLHTDWKDRKIPSANEDENKQNWDSRYSDDLESDSHQFFSWSSSSEEDLIPNVLLLQIYQPDLSHNIDENIALIKDNKLYAPSLFFHNRIVSFIEYCLEHLSLYVNNAIEHAWRAKQFKELSCEQIMADCSRARDRLITELSEIKTQDEMIQRNKNMSLTRNFEFIYMSDNTANYISIDHLSAQRNITTKINIIKNATWCVVNASEPDQITEHEARLNKARNSLATFKKTKRYLIDDAKIRLEHALTGYKNVLDKSFIPSHLLASTKMIFEIEAALSGLEKIKLSRKISLPKTSPIIKLFKHKRDLTDSQKEHLRLVLAGRGTLNINYELANQNQQYDSFLILKMAVFSGDLETLQCAEKFIGQAAANGYWDMLDLELIEKRIAHLKPRSFSKEVKYYQLALWYRQNAHEKWISEYDKYCLQVSDHDLNSNHFNNRSNVFSVGNSTSIYQWSDLDWEARALRMEQGSLIFKPEDKISVSAPKTLLHNNCLYLVAPSLMRHNEMIKLICNKYDAFLKYVKSKITLQQQDVIDFVAIDRLQLN